MGFDWRMGFLSLLPGADMARVVNAVKRRQDLQPMTAHRLGAVSPRVCVTNELCVCDGQTITSWRTTHRCSVSKDYSNLSRVSETEVYH